jgi:hypothetical protein
MLAWMMSTPDLVKQSAAYTARRASAEAALGGKPSQVDVTFCKVGDRMGYVVTVEPGEAVEIVVRSSAVPFSVHARYDG